MPTKKKAAPAPAKQAAPAPKVEEKKAAPAKAEEKAPAKKAEAEEKAPEFTAGWNDPPEKAVIDRSDEDREVDAPVGLDGGPVSPDNPEPKAVNGDDRPTGYERDN